MTNQAIPAEAVEAAAKGVFDKSYDPEGWDKATTLVQEHYRLIVRTALEAAAPHILRPFWDEAYGKGFEAGRGERDTPNPYEDES